MAKRGEVFLMCGLTGAGKTRFSRTLERERRAVRFSLDEWMIHLYGHHMSRELFDARLGLCKSLILKTAGKVLEVGVDVVLDFGFWKREERETMKLWLETGNLSHTLYYFDLPLEALWERLEARNQNLPKGTFEVNKEMLERFWDWFEPPTASEGFNLVHLKH